MVFPGPLVAEMEDKEGVKAEQVDDWEFGDDFGKYTAGRIFTAFGNLAAEVSISDGGCDAEDGVG